MKFGVQKNSASIANDMYKGGIFYLQKRIIGAYKNSPPSRLSPARQTRFYFPQNASELTQQLALQLRRSNSCRFLHASKILDLILTHSPESDTRKFKEDRKNKTNLCVPNQRSSALDMTQSRLGVGSKLARRRS